MTAGLAISFPRNGYLESASAILHRAATTIDRIRRGEITPPPRAPESVPAILTRSSEAIAQLRVLVVGNAPPEIVGACVRQTETVEEAARVLAAEAFRPEVILVPSPQVESELVLVTSCPIVIDHLGERRALRTRLRLAAALHAVRQVKGDG